MLVLSIVSLCQLSIQDLVRFADCSKHQISRKKTIRDLKFYSQCSLFSGAWVCFNNLNFLIPTVLSEFAKLMSTVIGALREGKTTAHMSGEEIQIHGKAACMAITTNHIKVSG